MMCWLDPIKIRMVEENLFKKFGYSLFQLLFG